MGKKKPKRQKKDGLFGFVLIVGSILFFVYREKTVLSIGLDIGEGGMIAVALIIGLILMWIGIMFASKFVEPRNKLMEGAFKGARRSRKYWKL